MERELVQHLVGRGVVRLAPVAEWAGGRAEEGEEPQRIRAQDTAQHERALGLGVEHAVERLRRLVLEQLVLDDAGPVDHAVQPAVLPVDRFDEAPHRALVARVGLHVAHAGARTFHAGEVRADLAVLHQPLVGGLDLGHRHRRAGLAHPLQQRGLQPVGRSQLARRGRLLGLGPR